VGRTALASVVAPAVAARAGDDATNDAARTATTTANRCIAIRSADRGPI
jgi:hypothetical protein